MNSKLLNSIQAVPSLSDEDKKDILESIFKILEENNLLTLSTFDNEQPHSCSAYYVYDDELNLYIWTDKNSLHAKQMKKNSKIAINIADTSQKWGSMLKGLQMSGEAKTISGKELVKVSTLYIKRFPKVSTHIKKIKDFIFGELESDLYKFEIKFLKILDKEKFGKEEYTEIIFVKN